MAPRKGICALALFPALALAQSTTQQSPAEKEKCVVTGRVTNALTGEPVKKAEVHLTYSNRRHTMSAPSGYGGIADAGGLFRFEGIEPGEYSLNADRPGFLRSSYGSKAPNQAGTNLVLAPGQQISDLNLALFPEGVITGRVVDEDGDPIRARVQTFVLIWKHGKQTVRPRGGSMTNDLGEYRCFGLGPGKYFISAQSGYRIGTSELPAIPGKADIRPVRTFFPDATSLENASPIQVQSGQSVTGMDIRLRTLPTYHVRGRVTGALTQTTIQGLAVSISPKDSGFNFIFDGSNVTKKGTFDLGGVPTGSYVLSLYSESEDFRVMGSTTLDISGSDVSDVVINVLPAGTLRGRIQIERAPQENGDSMNIGSIQLQLDPVEGPGWGSTTVKQDGTFNIENLGPGKYDLRLYPLPDSTYLKSVQLGQQEMLGKDLDFTQGVSGELLITLSYGVAEVGGTVQMPQQNASTDGSSNKPATAASIVLVPENLRPDGSGIEYGNPTQTGTFSIKNVAPGRYRAYAFEEMKRDQMDNPDFLKQLESKGVEVEVKENDKKQVQLTLIPAADVQQILAQLGIEGQ